MYSGVPGGARDYCIKDIRLQMVGSVNDCFAFRRLAIERLDLGGRASVTVHCIVLARVDFPVTYDNRLRIRV